MITVHVFGRGALAENRLKDTEAVCQYYSTRTFRTPFKQPPSACAW